ncbi:probable E3 ubiquitin ligase complex SCF subunit sconB [Patiria miniata]|uniref:F-box domain-containing protein n=1 Tax=Patiria miniata TaxID=46514 RepID=A0A914A947_PATMI|nr:probable E3 ubiquitin ligase complex SCF subunit sconB [Patiria miniata]
MATSQAEVNLTDLPQELKEHIFCHLTATDLCHLASCSRILKESTNQDAPWRFLCRKKGWERYGTTCDLCKEPPFKPTSLSQETGEGGVPTFPVDAVVTGSDWPGLVDTCKWKEVYMKARHLEENWKNKRFYTASLELYPFRDGQRSDFNPRVCNVTYEKHCVAAGKSNSTLEIWHMSSGKGQLIQVDISESPDALKMKDGIIAAGCKDGKIRTYSAQTGEQLQVMSGHSLAVYHLFFDGETIVSVARAGKFNRFKRFNNEEYERSGIRVWSAANGTSRCILQSGNEATSLVHLDYKNKIVAGAYSNNNIRIWDVSSGSCMQEIDRGMNKLTFCHLGDGIVIGASEKLIVKIWELKSSVCIKTLDVLKWLPPNSNVSREEVYFRFGGDELLAVATLYNGFFIMTVSGERLFTCPSSKGAPVIWKGNKLLAWSMKTKRYQLQIIDPTEREDSEAHDSARTLQDLDETLLACARMSNTELLLFVQQESPHVFVRYYW